MRELILIKNGEIALKGLNRNSFEDKRWAPVGARAQVVRPQTERLDQMEPKTFVAMGMQFLQQVLPQ